MKKDKWIWMPHAAHFICGNQCHFHLSTYVGEYIVSTVGELWNTRSSREIHALVNNPEWLKENKSLNDDAFDNAYMKQFGFEKIGCDRTYETMVFEAVKAKKGFCCPWRMKSGNDIDFRGYNDSLCAYQGHLRMCKKWSKK